jgi:hypothetical protein
MLGKCTDANPGVPTTICATLALSFFGLVDNIGDSFYEAGQEEACLCAELQ